MRKLADLPEKLWLALAFLLRAGLALKLGAGLYQADEHGFEGAAWTLAQTGAFTDQGQPMVMPPIPSWLFSRVFLVFGHHLTAARLFEAVLGTLLVWVVARLVRDLSRCESAGKLAMILAAVYPFFVYYGAMLMSETAYTLAAAAGLWWLCASLMDRGSSSFKAASAGLAFGLAGLCRGEGAAIAGVLLACALPAVLARRWSPRAWALAALFWALPLLGWAARNRAATGHWSLDTHGGMAMVHGTILFNYNEIDTSVAMDALHQMAFWQESHDLPDYEREKIYMQKSLEFMRENPGLTVAQWAKKAVNFWRPYPRQDKRYAGIPGNDPGAGFGRTAMVLVSLLFEPALILGGFWGLWTLRARWTELFPLPLFILGTMGVHVLSVSQMRYRLPVMPVLMLGLCSLLGARDAAHHKPPAAGAEKIS